MKFEQRNKELEMEMKQERTKQEQSEQKMRELEQIKIKLEEEIREQEKKIKCATELDRYEMGEGPLGICLVINNYNFLGEDERQGAKLDEEAIACLFEELHFIVVIRENLGGLEILKVAQEMAAKDHSNYAAFVFCIMSHGDKKDVIYGVDNRKAGMEDLMCEFTATNCPTLENKPKLFFIQACRGQRNDPRMNRLSASTSDNIAEDSIQIIHSPDADLANGVSPREADFLLAFATVPGYKAWRSKRVGSWFIQVLVDVIRTYHRHHHLLDMLTEVNKRVADIANEYPDVELSFQVPAPTHTLRKQVFL